MIIANQFPRLKSTIERVHKFLSVFLVYAILLNSLMPSVYAMKNWRNPVVSNNVFFSQNTFEINAQQSEYKERQDLSISTMTKIPIVTLAPLPPMPQQGETSGFSIGSTDGMVDKFTGDFSYSIPLLNAEGYPIVLAYNSNVSMLNEASWVGLGWNLNVGAISREMRGIPDEFNGNDLVEREMHQNDGQSVGKKNGGYISVGVGENSGASIGLSFLSGKYMDSYIGFGETFDFNISASARYSFQGAGEDGGLFLAPTINWGMSYDSKNGIGSNFGLGLRAGNKNETSSASMNLSYQRSKSSRYGLLNQSVSVGMSFDKYKNVNRTNKEGVVTGTDLVNKGGSGFSSTATFTYGTPTMVPRISISSQTDGSNFEQDYYIGLDVKGVSLRLGYLNQKYNSSSSVTYHSGNTIYQPAYGYLHSGKRRGYSGYYYPLMDFNRGIENEYSEEMITLPFSVQTHDVFYVNASGINGTFRAQRSDYGTYYDAQSENMYNNDSELLTNDDVTGVAIGLIIGVPFSLGLGIEYTSATMKGEQKSGNWSLGQNLLEFVPENASSNFDKAAYFRPMGSLTPVDMTTWNLLNGNTPDFFDINVSGSIVQQENYLKVRGQNPALSNDPTPGTINANSQTTYSEYLFKPNTAGEMTALGGYFGESFESVNDVDPISRIGEVRKANHISSIDVVNPDGIRYQYAIPTYVFTEQQVTFSTGQQYAMDFLNYEVEPVPGGDPLEQVLDDGVASNLITYNEGTDNSVTNSRGRSHYFDKTITPAYADGFLLTQMVGSDYIDRTNDGPTIDDIGNYYKFNYTRVYNESDPYGNRFPISGIFGENGPKAFYARGAMGTSWDDMANYTYSETELWYTHSIETKNLIVEFHLTEREDAYSADENGFLDNEKPKMKLSEIVVYNRNDRLINGDDAIPLQTIRLYYDYSLCQNAPGNLNTYNGSGLESGKLTLKEIRTYSGNSYENALSSISFEYGEDDENPDFSYSNADGWGDHKPNTQLTQNDIYPYADQDEVDANLSAKAWKLIAINNPAGGRIEIDYESDSYGYVQDRRAMRLFDVYRMTDIFDFLKIRQNGSWNGVDRASGNAMTESFITDYTSTTNFITELGLAPGTEALYNGAIFDKKPYSFYNLQFGQYDISMVPNNVIIFKLDEDLSSSDQDQADALVADLYFRDSNDLSKSLITELFTKMYVEVKDGVYDLIPSMSAISKNYDNDVFGGIFINELQKGFKSYGAMPKNPATNKHEYGYVIVDPVHTGKRGNKDSDEMKKGDIAVHPMQLAALEYSRQALSDKVYGADPGSTGDLTIDEKVIFGDDIYKYMIEIGYCNLFNADNHGKSLMRLNEPDYIKYGGGARVKEIRYFDNWEAISGEYDSQYSWHYKYSTLVGRHNPSTGVAAFEPMTILDEDPFNDWITYTNIRKKFPDENKFIPGPLSYQLFPKPVVGYEKVEVTFNEGADFGFIEPIDYGKSTTKYYTAKDYPTVTDKTTIDKSAKISQNNFLTGKVREVFGYTQGYVVETNDFHGKLRLAQVTKKDEDGSDTQISKTVYEYYDKGEQVQLADRAGNIGLYNVALEFDVHADSKYATDETKFVQAGLDFVLTWTPLILFTPSFKLIYNQATRERSFYSHALIKHINYSAVLKNITTDYLGSINTATTNVFDKYTGSPVVSELTDEYNDKLYQVNYPSHWKYKELRSLHEINGASVTINVNADGEFTPSSANANDAISPGDIVFVDGQNLQVGQAWPWPLNGELFLMEQDGTMYTPSVTGNKTAVIIKSNRDNRLTESMQSFTTKVNPVVSSEIVCPIDNIYSASAITYRDRLQALCGDPCPVEYNNNSVSMNTVYNPYHFGLRGDLVLDNQFAWQSNRSSFDDPHKSRFDGAYKNDEISDPNFILFYEGDGTGNWAPISSSFHLGHDPTEKYRLWRPMGNITEFDQYGNALEAKDQINVHSAMLMGYSATYSTLPVAQAVNARKEQIAFDGFEDYDINGNLEGRCRVPESHFDFYEDVSNILSGITISETVRHSGIASLRVNPNKTASVSKTISELACYPYNLIDDRGEGSFKMDTCACISPFAPTPGKYVIGVWINGAISDATVEVILDEGSPISFQSEGPILDGWQRLEGVFTIPPGTSTIEVRLKNVAINKIAYFDDLRIHPFLAGMQTTVYHPQTFLPMATHDGYNFTTYYNYDENLNLVRVRVETVDGIKTVMESESGGQKSFTE